MMTTSEIARRRMDNQQITNPIFDEPGEVVSWLGAVQAQDYLGSLWAVGLRTHNAVEADIERAKAGARAFAEAAGRYGRFLDASVTLS